MRREQDEHCGAAILQAPWLMHSSAKRYEIVTQCALIRFFDGSQARHRDGAWIVIVAGPEASAFVAETNPPR